MVNSKSPASLLFLLFFSAELAEGEWGMLFSLCSRYYAQIQRGKRLSSPSARSGGDGEADGEDKEGGGIIIC